MSSAAPALAYQDSVQPDGQRFRFQSELSALGDGKPLLLWGCNPGGPSQVHAQRIRQYYDKSTDVHLWIITTPSNKDILFYSTGGFACTIRQQ
jgi:hypothetical protein